jgi:hypothetical protein
MRTKTLGATKRTERVASGKIIETLHFDAQNSPLKLVFQKHPIPDELKEDESRRPCFPSGSNWMAAQLPWDKAAHISDASENYFFEGKDWCIDGFDLMARGIIVGHRDEEGFLHIEGLHQMRECELLPANPTISDYAAAVIYHYDQNVRDLDNKDHERAAPLRFALDAFIAPAYRAVAAKLKADIEKSPTALRSVLADRRTALKYAFEFAFFGKSETDILVKPVNPQRKSSKR